ncbi:hypothetical protein ACOCHS_06255 [Propionibacteriaceae bacterium Y2011]
MISDDQLVEIITQPGGLVINPSLISNGGFDTSVDGWLAQTGVGAPVWSSGSLQAAGNGTNSGMLVRPTPSPWGVSAGQTVYVRARVSMASGQVPTQCLARIVWGTTTVVDPPGWAPGPTGHELRFSTVAPMDVTPTTPCSIHLGVRLPANATATDVLQLDEVIVSTEDVPYSEMTEQLTVWELPSPLWVVTAVDGLLDGAAAVYEQGQRVQADGVWKTRSFRGPLAGGMTGQVVCRTPEECEQAMATIRRTVALTPAPLTFHFAQGDQTIMVERDGVVAIERVTPLSFRWSATVIARDPRWYAGGQDNPDAGITYHSTGLPQTSGGLRAPVTAPFTVGGSSATGDLLITTADGGVWEWRIDGPVTNPRVIVDQGDGLRTVGWQLSLLADEYLIIDPQARTSMLQGTAARPPSQRQWPLLAPGTQRVQFRADDYHPLAKLTVAVRPAV